MIYLKSVTIRKFILVVLLLAPLWLTACGELEFGVETKVSSGRPDVTVVTTVQAEIPEGMALVTVTPTAQATSPVEGTSTPTVARTNPSAPTAVPTQTPTKAASPTPLSSSLLQPTHAPVLPSSTPTPEWPELLTYPSVSATVWAGDDITVEYEARGRSASICLAPVFTEDWTCHNAPISGPHTIPTAPNVNANLQLKLNVYTDSGEVGGMILVMLYCDADEWFFSAPPATCPANAPQETAAAYQRFEHGQMFWLEKGRWWQPGEIIYVLYDSPARNFETFPQHMLPASDTPMPEIDYNPPEGFFVPQNGFGLLWRENTYMRQQLGWAVAPEVGFTTTVQEEMVRDGVRLYLQNYEDETLVLHTFNASWDKHPQP